MWSNISSPPKSLKLVLKQEVHHHNREVRQEEDSEPSNKTNSSFSSGDDNSNFQIQAAGSPLMRYKHAVCSAPTGFIYIHGGRFGNLPLDDDVWRFDPHQNSWFRLETKGERPPSLQEHTLVEHDERLYLFGGQVSAANCDSSFWQLDLLSGEWRSLARQSSKLGAHLGPTNRRGHSAVVYRDSMYIFGGFEDFRGSSAQLWEFDLLNHRWELRNLSSSSACHPEPRHSHSAIVYVDSMFVYGGLSNLKPLGDLWRWSWRDKRWFKERTRGRSPGQLHGHTAIQAFGSMFVFGGERNGRPTRSLWRLNLTNLTWQKVRSKGPRPNPTTWHGAIANPLSILDEANYIIEGGCAYQDEELLKTDGSLGDSSCPNVATYATIEQQLLNTTSDSDAQQQLNRPQTDVKPILGGLSHSKSSLSATSAAAAASKVPVQCERSVKRKSRLGGFLRRSRHDRTSRSNYELMKQQQQLACSSASAVANLAATAGSGQKHVPSASADATMLGGHKQEASGGTNIKILDSLDTVIKEMFQRALSPDKMMATDGEDELEPMSVDPVPCGAGADEITLSSIVTSSQYQTAIATGPPMTNDLSTGSAYRGGSQRTSYAYATPPSELNTLKRETPAREAAAATARNGNQQQQLAVLASGTPAHSGYDRRNNRPKSEIVQSLIERADARIKHLYTPYFNHPQQSDHSSRHHRISSGGGGIRSSAGNQQQYGSHYRNNRHSFNDKSKRHTIHQTMTYYNLYFGEDKSSSSTQSDASGPAQAREEETGEATQDRVLQQQQRLDRMVQDDLSSSTIRGGVMTPGSSGALVGVHGGSPHVDSHQHQSQLSLEANSSDSRTLCGELSLTCGNNGLQLNGNHQENCSTELFASSGSSSDTMANTSNSGLLLSGAGGGQSQTSLSLQNALTARRDTGESCDNTSLSFSVIAEFEEDDMLQYSSPTDPVIMRSQQHAQQQSLSSAVGRQSYRNVARDNQDEDGDDDYDLEDDERQADIRRQQQDIAKKQAASASAVERLTELAGLHSRSSVVALDEGQQQQPKEQQQQLQAHKSASSGYESISGSGEHTSRSRTESRHGQSQHSPGDYSSKRGATNGGKQQPNTPSDSHEDSSVRTESSLGFTTTETSPEQSMHKKMRGRQLIEFDPNRNHHHYPRHQLNRTNGGATVSSSVDDNQMSPKLTASSTTADSLALASSHDDGGFEAHLLAIKSLPSSATAQQSQLIAASVAASASVQRERKLPLVSRARFLGKRKSKNRYWQLCMFVIGGKQGGIHGINEPITIWRLYI